MIADECPCLVAMKVTYKAKYLGIWMGPEGACQAWNEALQKFTTVASKWSGGAVQEACGSPA